MKRCLFLVLLFSHCPCWAEDVDVYLLGGQSNMQGIGRFEELPEADLSIEGVWFFTGTTFEPLTPGKTKTSNRASEFGPEIGFARVIGKAGRPVYLIKYSASGMPLDKGWNGGRWGGRAPAQGRRNFHPGEERGDPATGTLYRAMMTHFHRGLDVLREQDHIPMVRGFLWMQGEQDSKHETSAHAYAANLGRLRERVAADIGVPSLPIVFGQVLPHTPAKPRFGHREVIRAQMAAADERSGKPPAMARARMVSTDTFSLKEDTVHYDGPGQLALGEAMAVAMKELLEQEAKRPNIVFFFVDDMGWQDTSVPFHQEATPLNRDYRTPHLERLAKDGLLFTNAYACSVCSPSRVSLMTGMNAARHRVTCWTLRKDRSPEGRRKGLQPAPWNLNGLQPKGAGIARSFEADCLPKLLHAAGYHTIHAGKGHFGAKDTPGGDPRNLGFETNIAGSYMGGPGSYHGDKNFSAQWRGGDTIWDIPGLEAYHGQRINLTEAMTREVIAELDRTVAAGRPFYLYLSHYAVHAPWEPDRRFIDNYGDEGWSKHKSVFASMLEGMDDSLGAIRAALDRLGVADNTMVVFMSDNGSPKQNPQNLPLRGHKISAYEGGSRVPLIVHWPGTTRGGTRTEAPMIIEDIFPTFLEWAGVSVPKAIDGVSLVPVMRDPSTDRSSRPLFWHYPNLYDQPPHSSVRLGQYKLIYFHHTRTLELYDLRNDLGETTNLVAEFPDRVKKLAKLLSDHLRETGADLPLDATTGEPIALPEEVAAF